MKLFVFQVKYFTSIEWEWKELSFIAESEEQIRTCIDKECRSEFRNRPWTSGKEKEDSLEIEQDMEVTIPFQLTERY